jgi:dipeptidyl aminopeptidase/acylaminoacyl peptidase
MKLSRTLWSALVGLLYLLASAHMQVVGGPGGATISSSPGSASIAATLGKPPSVLSGEVSEDRGRWSPQVQRITYASSADHTSQPAMFYKAGGEEPRPLLVALHSWSSDYQQPQSAIYAEWAIANGWNFIHPNFRGRNVRPAATGSELVINDVLSAVDYAKQKARVDGSRIYAVGWSGGGHLALLLAARSPDIWAGVSTWVPISDLNAWYNESRRRGTKYAREIAASCGGAPETNPTAAAECRKRSPLTQLKAARNVPVDINHGIRDGHDGPVPVSQSVRAFNVLAEAGNRLSEEEIIYMTKHAKLPASLEAEENYPAYRNRAVLFRRQSGRARLTIFDGGHLKDTEAAFTWLNAQKKG